MTASAPTSPSPITEGIHHLGLTVPDVKQSANFFIEALNFKLVGEKPDYPALFISDGTVMLTLWQATNPAEANPFDRQTNLGLHHFALRVKNENLLNSLSSDLQKRSDVKIEFPPEPLGQSPMRHMMCYVPGGLRLELVTSTEA